MLEYEIIKEYENSLSIKFKSCGHTQGINKIHIESNEFTCNKCSNINNEEHFYNYDVGLQHKSEMVRKCRICKEEDKAINLISIPQTVKNGINFWFFHQRCMDKFNHTKESIKDIIDDDENKNKIASFQNRNKKPSDIKRVKKPKISKSQLIIINEEKIKNNQGNIVIDPDIGFRVLNKSYYDIDNFNGLCGVYAIHNIDNNRRYVGSSRNLRQRFKSHYKAVVDDKHHSYKFQRDFNWGDEKDFESEILEILDENCTNKILYITEQKYMDLVDASKSGYNLNPIAGFSGSATECFDLMTNQ